jgi:hypothetical protein
MKLEIWIDSTHFEEKIGAIATAMSSIAVQKLQKRQKKPQKTILLTRPLS